METGHHVLVPVFGILGNTASFLVYFAPIVTFYDIYCGGSTLDYDAVPYSMALFCATLSLYYAYLKGNEETLLIATSSFGCGIEVVYLIIFYIFATNRVRRRIVRMVFLFNGMVYLSIICSSSFVSPLHKKLKVMGWICATSAVGVYASPLSVIRRVIRTKSVKSVPMPLSRCLTLSSIVWFFYGCFSHDYSIVMASVLGCLLSVAQIILYRKWNGSGDDERERVAIASKTRENNKDTLDDEVLQVIDIAVRKVKVRKSDNSNEEEENATRVELEATETVELQNIAVTGNDSVMDSEIHSVVEPEIVEVLDKPKYAMLDRAPSKLS